MSYYEKITIVKALIKERPTITQEVISEIMAELEAIELSFKAWPMSFAWRIKWPNKIGL